MAQWLGQFSGNTHATRVADIEDAMRHAVAALRTAKGTDAAVSKAKAARRLAEQLFAARIRLLEVRLDAATPLTSEQSEARPHLDKLRSRIVAMQAEGVRRVLEEFEISDDLLGE